MQIKPAMRICFVAMLLGLLSIESANGADKKVSDEQIKLLKVFVSEFVDITPGKGRYPKSFIMGSADGAEDEKPAHQVTFSSNFSIAKYEVPQNLYEAVMGSNPSRWKGPRNSVEMFDYRDAVKFCTELTEMLRSAKLLDDDQEIRLPTEAEWEYCCRAGTKTRYSFGDHAAKDGDEGAKASLLDPYAWHTGNAAGNDPPVGALKPNAWGLYDMHGYLWEFVQDAWQATYSDASADGSARKSKDKNAKYVVRGGSWRERHERLTSTARMAVSIDFKRDDVGFRCVRAKVAR